MPCCRVCREVRIEKGQPHSLPSGYGDLARSCPCAQATPPHLSCTRLEITLFGNGMISSQRSFNAHRVSSTNDDATVHLQQIHYVLTEHPTNHQSIQAQPQAASARVCEVANTSVNTDKKDESDTQSRINVGGARGRHGALPLLCKMRTPFRSGRACRAWRLVTELIIHPRGQRTVGSISSQNLISTLWSVRCRDAQILRLSIACGHTMARPAGASRGSWM